MRETRAARLGAGGAEPAGGDKSGAGNNKPEPKREPKSGGGAGGAGPAAGGAAVGGAPRGGPPAVGGAAGGNNDGATTTGAGGKKNYITLSLANKCSRAVEAAVYYLSTDRKWVTAGWFRIPPGEARAVAQTPNTLFYVSSHWRGWGRGAVWVWPAISLSAS